MSVPRISPPEPLLTINLTKDELAFATSVGKLRRARNVAAGVNEKIFSGKDPALINIQGSIGEGVFAKMFGFPWDINTKPRKGGVDFECRNGIMIDVKHTEQTVDPQLRNSQHKIERDYHADVYVLIAGPVCGPKFSMMGYAFSGELMREENIDRGSYVLPARKLRWDLEGFRILIGEKR